MRHSLDSGACVCSRHAVFNSYFEVLALAHVFYSAIADGLDCVMNCLALRIEHRFLRAGTLLVDGYELRICAVPHPDEPHRIKAAAIPPVVRERLDGKEGSQ